MSLAIPKRTLDPVQQSVLDAAAAHAAQLDNPHDVTANQLSCYTSAQIDLLLQQITQPATGGGEGFEDGGRI